MEGFLSERDKFKGSPLVKRSKYWSQNMDPLGTRRKQGSISRDNPEDMNKPY